LRGGEKMGLFEWVKGGGKEIYNLSYHILGETLGKKLADVGVTKTTERIFEDKRGELMADILSIAPDNQNLLRRHKEAIGEYRENRFVTLLAKIPRFEFEMEESELEEKGQKKKVKKEIKKEVRREVLRNLDTLSDQDFKQYLELLEHDLVRQVLKRLMVPTITPAKESAEKARDFLGQKMRKRLEELNRRKIEREIPEELEEGGGE